MLRKASWTQLACQRRRTSAIPDDLDFLFFLIDMLQVAVIYPLLAQFAEQENGECGIEIAQSGSAYSILKHHALRKARGRIIAG